MALLLVCRLVFNVFMSACFNYGLTKASTCCHGNKGDLMDVRGFAFFLYHWKLRQMAPHGKLCELGGSGDIITISHCVLFCLQSCLCGEEEPIPSSGKLTMDIKHIVVVMT